MKTYDKVGRESGNFPPTEKELQELKRYQRQLKNIKVHLSKGVK